MSSLVNTSARRHERLLKSTILASVAALGAPVALSGAVFFAPSNASAQDFTRGSLNGSVVTTSGEPVSGASVIVTSNAQGFSQTTTTADDGSFVVSQLPIGSYTVSISGSSIEDFEDADIAISLGGRSSYQFAVRSTAGGEGEIVVLGSRRLRTGFDQNTTGIVVDVQDTFERLPVVREGTAVQLLAPQTTLGDNAFGRGNLGTLASISGSSVAENVYYINGMNITNFRTFVGGSEVPFEFYDAIEVKTGGYSAEYGRSTGGAVIATSRSGGNEFHAGLNAFFSPGDLYEQAPNTNLNTNLNELDERERTDANVWLSGPIWRDRIFFFGFYNERNSETLDALTESAQRVESESPFYGGRIDINVTDDHRFTYTRFSDDEEQEQTSYERDPGTGALSELGVTQNLYGGTTESIQYTGNLVDWLTLSLLYGTNFQNQTSRGTLDGTPYVLDGRSGTPQYVNGNPAGVIEAGADERELFRADADLYFDLFGDHHLRIGYDRETLGANTVSQYSGGVYYRYYRCGDASCLDGAATAGDEYVRVRYLTNGGSFETQQSAWYIQDVWDVSERLTLQLGVRSETFENYSSQGELFISSEDLIAPRIGFSYDLSGDGEVVLSGFAGRYHLPIATNTNLRMAGTEYFTEQFYEFTAIDGQGLPTLGPALTPLDVLSDTSNAFLPGFRAQDIEAQYADEYLIGIELPVPGMEGWRGSINLAHRTLGAAIEDLDTNYIVDQICAENGVAAADCNGELGSGGYVLANPGRPFDVMGDLDADGDAELYHVSAAAQDMPEVEREYDALEFVLEREFDGAWGARLSYVLSRTRGNYEGGVKSDNGQDDTGLTTDFDEPGWMDGSYGELPNSRRHNLKLEGTWSPIEDLILGANVRINSGRKYGCIGVYPFADGRARSNISASWYCDGALTPRGSQFTGDWVSAFDLSAAYSVDLPFGSAQIRADIFNLFDQENGVDFYEQGEFDDGSNDARYRQPSSYQTPRYVRLGVSYQF